MTNEISEAVRLLFVGMLTVFIILSLVVLMGHFLIWLTNKIDAQPIVPLAASNADDEINATHRAAIQSAIKSISNGKQIIEKIERI